MRDGRAFALTCSHELCRRLVERIGNFEIPSGHLVQDLFQGNLASMGQQLLFIDDLDSVASERGRDE